MRIGYKSRYIDGTYYNFAQSSNLLAYSSLALLRSKHTQLARA
jgi:hypothetical protein